MFTICSQFGHTLFTTDLYNVLKDKGREYSKRVLKVIGYEKYIELNNETFEVKKAKCELHPMKEVRTLENCYARPSGIKKAIWNEWFNWYLSVESPKYQIVNMSIESYNPKIFTIRMDVFTKKYKFIGYIYITKTRQEFWTI